MFEHGGFCHEFVVYIIEWTQSRGTLVWHGQSEGLVALLLGVEGAWVQFVMQVQFFNCQFREDGVAKST